MPPKLGMMEGQGVGRTLRLLRNRLPRLRAGQSQNNPGEAVTEPERIQEHSPSSFAGGQHFFEYLLVVSLKKKRLGNDYEPTITYQFPKVRMEGEVGPEDGGGRTEVCLKGNRGVLYRTMLPGL